MFLFWNKSLRGALLVACLGAAAGLRAADSTPPLVDHWSPADGAVFDAGDSRGVDVLMDFQFSDPETTGLTGSVKAYSPSGVTLTLQSLADTIDSHHLGSRGYVLDASKPGQGLTETGSYTLTGYGCNADGLCVAKQTRFSVRTSALATGSADLVVAPHPLGCPGSRLRLPQAAPGRYEARVLSDRGAQQGAPRLLDTGTDASLLFLPCDGLPPGLWRLELRALSGPLRGRVFRRRLWVR